MILPALRRKSRGTVLLYALAVLLVGAVVLAGWMSLLGSRMLYNEQRTIAINERITMDNSRALATQYILQNVLPGSFTTAPTFSFGTLNGWGSFTITGFGLPATPLNSITVQRPVNHFSPGGGSGFTIDFPVTLFDGSNNYNWLFSTKSRSPIFASDFFTVLTPTISAGSSVSVTSGVTVGGALTGGGNVVLWKPDSPNTYFNLATQTYATPTVTLPSATLYASTATGSALLMSDFAFLPVTSGAAGSDFGYDGSISVVNPSGTVNSLLASATASSYVLVSGSVNNSGVISTASGSVSINLTTGSSVSAIYIVGSATTITLLGQAGSGDATANTEGALLIVDVQTSTTARDLTKIVLSGYNNRRIYLGIKKSNGGATVAVTPSSASALDTWRLAGTFENTALNFTMGTGTTLAITGGLRTDQSVTVTSGSLQFWRETSPLLLEYDADRTGWLETFRQ